MAKQNLALSLRRSSILRWCGHPQPDCRYTGRTQSALFATVHYLVLYHARRVSRSVLGIWPPVTISIYC
jgi:hypothetical protein